MEFDDSKVIKVPSSGSIESKRIGVKSDTKYNFEVKEFAKVLLHAVGERSERSIIESEFLGCETNDLSAVRGDFKIYEIAQGRYALDKLFESTDVKIHLKTSFTYDGDTNVPEYEDTEISPGKYKQLFSGGTVFLEYKKTPIAIHVYEDQGLFYRIYADKKYTELLAEISAKIREISDAENMFRGKPIEISSKSEFKFMSDYPKISWNDFILEDSIKRELEIQVINIINNIDSYREAKIPLRRGVLLEGAPGTGKTLIGKLMINLVKATFMLVSAKSIREPDDIRTVYEAARKFAPTIVFFEDIDLFGYDRDMGSNSVLGELLTQMDGINDSSGVFTIATTNKRGTLDQALVNRPNRFDSIINFGYPDVGKRRKILTLYNTKYDAGVSDTDIEEIAIKSKDFTPAYLNELMVYAKILAHSDGRQKVMRADLDASLKKILPSAEKQKEMYG